MSNNKTNDMILQGKGLPPLRKLSSQEVLDIPGICLEIRGISREIKDVTKTGGLMKTFFKYWAIGVLITVLLFLFVFLVTLIWALIIRLSPAVGQVIEFAVAFGCLSIFFGCVVWAIAETTNL